MAFTIDLAESYVLVTGGSAGIGAAISKTLAQSGAKVALQYNSSEHAAQALKDAFPESIFPFRCDLKNSSSIQTLYNEVMQRFPNLNVLVNNAGIAKCSPLHLENESWLDDWQETLQVNLVAPALLSKLFVNNCRNKQQQGRIINISSRAAFRGDTEDYLAYAASKAGLVTLTKSLSRAAGKQDIKVFDIAPGFTRTAMAAAFIEKYGEQFALNDIALKDLTTPENISPMVMFLASGLADHATGTTIDMNAGSYVH